MNWAFRGEQLRAVCRGLEGLLELDEGGGGCVGKETSIPGKGGNLVEEPGI